MVVRRWRPVPPRPQLSNAGSCHVVGWTISKLSVLSLPLELRGGLHLGLSAACGKHLAGLRKCPALLFTREAPACGHLLPTGSLGLSRPPSPAARRPWNDVALTGNPVVWDPPTFCFLGVLWFCFLQSLDHWSFSLRSWIPCTALYCHVTGI